MRVSCGVYDTCRVHVTLSACSWVCMWYVVICVMCMCVCVYGTCMVCVGVWMCVPFGVVGVTWCVYYVCE